LLLTRLEPFMETNHISTPLTNKLTNGTLHTGTYHGEVIEVKNGGLTMTPDASLPAYYI